MKSSSTGNINVSLITDYDVFLFKQGKHFNLYKKLGAHFITVNGIRGVFFGVWAPNATYVSVIGDFNGWNKGAHLMDKRPDGSGIWELFIPELRIGDKYKYFVRNDNSSYEFEKADPFALYYETPPSTASVIWDISYKWNDDRWMKKRSASDDLPVSVYELHLGSWKRKPDGSWYSYIEFAHQLIPYIKDLGFTHVELLPITEYPYYPSWGYQTTGYFAPTSRFGAPHEFMALVEELHNNKIGVILDWVPSHFPSDGHALSYFDGTHLFEHPDPRKGFHPDWKSCIFNYESPEVRSFLISSALFWLEKYHIDGIRVDAVASMLYLNYSRKEGEWLPNELGGNENLAAIKFLQDLNEAINENFPTALTIAEESTAYPGVTKPVKDKGLGFNLKWMMGWMHDSLSYLKRDPLYRKHHHDQITFSFFYGFHEKFMLPLSHDEVVHGKGSMINKMPGNDWDRFANLRLLYSFMYAHPGSKLLFMGAEIAQYKEWDFLWQLDWHLLENDLHKGIHEVIKSLNKLYTEEPALHELNYSPAGFEWVDNSDWEQSILVFIRKSDSDHLVVAVNFTPIPRLNYRIGLPEKTVYHEIFSSDQARYNGSGNFTNPDVQTERIVYHNRKQSALINIPPLSLIILKPHRQPH